MGKTLYARLYNRDVTGPDVTAGPPTPPAPPLPASVPDQGTGKARDPEPAPSDDEMSLDEDLLVVD